MPRLFLFLMEAYFAIFSFAIFGLLSGKVFLPKNGDMGRLSNDALLGFFFFLSAFFLLSFAYSQKQALPLALSLLLVSSSFSIFLNIAHDLRSQKVEKRRKAFQSTGSFFNK